MSLLGENSTSASGWWAGLKQEMLMEEGEGGKKEKVTRVH